MDAGRAGGRRGPGRRPARAGSAPQQSIAAYGRAMPQLRWQSPIFPRRCYGHGMARFRIGESAELLGVSADTVRRCVDAGRLPAVRDEHGHRAIDGADLAAFARSQAGAPDGRVEASSARNRLRGIVTAVVKDTVMAKV